MGSKHLVYMIRETIVSSTPATLRLRVRRNMRVMRGLASSAGGKIDTKNNNRSVVMLVAREEELPVLSLNDGVTGTSSLQGSCACARCVLSTRRQKAGNRSSSKQILHLRGNSLLCLAFVPSPCAAPLWRRLVREQRAGGRGEE